MFDFSTIDEVKLAEGAHYSPHDGLCFMEMAAWFAGEKHSDHPECACPVLGSYGIRLNDRMPAEVRDRLLKPMVPLIVGTRDKGSEQRRSQFLAMWAVNKVLPIVLRARGFTDHANACERAGTLNEAKNAANAAAYAAANAAKAAANAANAAAYAANAAAYAAADAAADAAAYAAAYAANAADAANGIWTVAVEGLRQAILIGRHDGFGFAEDVLIERRQKLRELVRAEREKESEAVK